jgi:HNH endonuclease
MPKGVYQRKPLAERLWAKVDKNGPVPAHRPELGPCWLWTGKAEARGHGQIMLNYHHQGTHRVAYELVVGPIPEGYDLDHLCHNDSGCPGGNSCPHRRCVNPAHLQPVTPKENILRGAGLAAQNARKTHCPRGHEYSAENTRISRSGKRTCRTCERARKQRARMA